VRVVLAVSLFVCLIAVAAVLSPADAAVRSCLPPVTSDVAQADTELAGKRKALESWTAKVLRFGPGFTRWQLATRRQLVCRPNRTQPGRGFACVASAAPCTIDQIPSQPKRRLTPRPGRNVPFEV
jgi:hypothetical protein